MDQDNHALSLTLDPLSGLWYRPWANDLKVIAGATPIGKLGVHPGDVALDLGAHIGAVARRFTTLGARVVAVEPHPDNFAVLLRNAEGWPIVCVNAAVAKVTGPVTLHTAPSTQLHSLVPWQRRSTIAVQGVTLQSLLDEHQPTVIKCDIEGAEYQVMDTWLNLPSYVRALVMELHWDHPRKDHGVWLDMTKRPNYWMWVAAHTLAAGLNQRYTVLRAPGSTGWATLGVWERR
jgi:FkbM family methyltransferase